MNYLYFFFFSLLALTTTPALSATGDVNIFIGNKILDTTDWAYPYDKQNEFGVLTDIANKDWPINLAVGLLGSEKTVEYGWENKTASTFELDIGVRKIFISDGDLHPFAGGGVAFIDSSHIDTYSNNNGTSNYTWYTEQTTDNYGTGYWLDAGIYLALDKHFNLGIEGRYSKADVDIYNTYQGDTTVNAGGKHVGVFIGYHW